MTLVDYPGTNLDTTYVYGTNAAAFEKGRLLSITRGTDVVAYTWDRFGRMLTDGALTYTWDKNGRRTSVTYPGNLKANYTFDRMDREASMTMQENGGTAITLVSATAGYKAFGPLATTVHPTTTSRTVTRNYDLRYAPTSIVVSGSQFTWNYTVDGAGNPTAISQTLPTPVSRTYGYQDTQYFLDSASGPWNGPLSWSYDRIGNRLSETRNSITDTYSYEPNSGLTGNTARLDLVNLGIGGTRDYTFDAGGFLDLVDLGANQVDFTFDAAGQLSQVARPVAGETLNLRYDGRGFLCDASDVVSGGYTRPTYSSQGVVMSWNRLPSSGGTAEIHNVLYFAGMPVVIWSKVGAAASTRQYLVADHLGTPAFAFNTAGVATWNGGLEPFGKDWQEGTANDMLTKGIFLRFPGQWDDALFTNASLGADVYYNVHRWLEPAQGRYLSTDPLGRWGDPHPYAYARLNPGRLIDRLGLDSAGCDVSPEAQARIQAETGLSIPFESRCVLQCCAYHDACFDRFGCDQHSWLQPGSQCNPRQCGSCNETVVRCIRECANSGFANPKEGPLYYCASRSQFISIPGDFDNLDQARRACDNGGQVSCCGEEGE